MRKILAGQDEQVADWVAAKVPMMDLGDSPFSAIGLLDTRGYLIAGVVYSNFTRTDVQCHIALLHKRALSRFYLRECFWYPFVQLAVHRITVGVASSNEASLKLVDGLGFTAEGRLREYFDNGDDCLVYGMLRRECRWLEYAHGTSASRHPAASELRGRSTTRIGDGPAPGTDAAQRHAAAAADFRRKLGN